MTTKIAQLILVLLLPLFIYGQKQSMVDSLNHRLRIAQTDTARAQELVSLGLYYMESNRDSCLHYAEELVSLSKRMKHPLLEVTGMVLKAYTIYHQGNLLPAYKIVNEALAIAQDEKNGKNLWVPSGQIIPKAPEKFRLSMVSTLLQQLGHIYSAAGNPDKGLEYYKKALNLAATHNFRQILLNYYMNVVNSYLEQKQLDSALVYSTLALKSANQTDAGWFLGYYLLNVGEIHFQKGEFESARQCYWQSLLINRQQQFVLLEIHSNLLQA